MKRISEIEGEPVVGEFYLVPCVRVDTGGWMPVIGPRHEDKAIIGFEQEHYHKDVRFMPPRQIWGEFEHGIVRARRLLRVTPEEWAMANVMVRTGPPVLRRRKCYRRMPAFPLQLSDAGRPKWQTELERVFKDARACEKCPHRGMPLKGLPVKDGKVICPGHGLQFDVETGVLVPRS